MENNKQTLVLLCLVMFLNVSGCNPIKQGPEVNSSGFLGDYSALQKGNKGEAQKVYIHSDYAQTCSNYDKIMIEPISLWVHDTSDLATLPEDERQGLVNHLHSSLVYELGKYYHLVQKPSPGTLRVRSALTEADGSNVALDTLSTFLPQMLVASRMKELATGTASFVGKASAEVEITDAMTGERIAAAVDSMVGAKSSIGVTDKWDDVSRVFNVWADHLTYRLINCGASLPTQ